MDAVHKPVVASGKNLIPKRNERTRRWSVNHFLCLHINVSNVCTPWLWWNLNNNQCPKIVRNKKFKTILGKTFSRVLLQARYWLLARFCGRTYISQLGSGALRTVLHVAVCFIGGLLLRLGVYFPRRRRWAVVSQVTICITLCCWCVWRWYSGFPTFI